MPPAPDDDDWVGTPPEGRHSADRARPDFWRRQRPPMIVAAAIGILIAVAVVIALLS
jgi:predicted nucleic acid-binding Zn ribbon protein